jgi:enoyl-CoA hydratase/carnithine racemase
MTHETRFSTIKVVRDGTLAWLTLNRPERLNAMNAEMLRELVEAARAFDEDHDIRVVIVQGEGRAFSAGADLRDSPSKDAADSSKSWFERRDIVQNGRRMADAMEAMRATTIARLHGYVIGGGVVLASACDIRIAEENTIFSIPEVALGIPLAWGGIPRLVRDIGPALTKELVMSCREFSASEAAAMRFINHVVPAVSLDEKVLALAREIAAMPSVPVAITKEHVNAVAKAMTSGFTSFADGDALMNALASEESLKAREEYKARRLGRKKP